jgi:hypothetical protein
MCEENSKMKLRGLSIGLGAIALIASSVACCFSGFYGVRGSGRLEEKEYEVEGFDGVTLTNQGNLTIEHGAQEALVVEAEANLLPYLEVQVVDHVLHIRTRPNVWLRPTRPIRYHLTANELSSIKLTGSGNAEGPVLEGDDVAVRVTGSGDIVLDGIDAEDSIEIRVTGSGNVRVTGNAASGASVRGDRVHVTVTGSGDVNLGELEGDQLDVRLTGSGDLAVGRGCVEDQTISTSGSGVYRARDLESATAVVLVGGSSDVTISVADELDAEVTGSGGVRYVGHPAIREHTSGSADVKRVGE